MDVLAQLGFCAGRRTCCRRDRVARNVAELTLVNMLSAGAFGEFEYWLAGIKVFAIVFFIACGIWLISDKASTTEWVPTLRVEGELFPFGIAPIFQCMAIVVYSFQGAELVGNVAS